ncbi:MAG: hypothetical protein Q9166_006411 [cf. Caloplaca sp. 2 TL-2023]
MLEQQQSHLVNGLQIMYGRLVNNDGWLGPPLELRANGHPLTHDILERLDALQIEGSPKLDQFEENPEVLQQKLVDDGDIHITRQPSPDSDSSEDHASSPDTLSPAAPAVPPPPKRRKQQPPAPIQTSSDLCWDATAPTFGSVEAMPISSAHSQQPQLPWLRYSDACDSPTSYYNMSRAPIYDDSGQFAQDLGPYPPTNPSFDDEMRNFGFNSTSSFEMMRPIWTHSGRVT